ncbi:MAG: heparinase II/III domain-containing protein [Armatimonadota bacterium]
MLRTPLLLISLCLCAIIISPAWSKTVRNYYTPARLAIMRANLEKYDWARQERDRILKEADRWAAYDDERLRDLVPPPTVPRSIVVANAQCPVHGQEVLKVASMYGWKMDFDQPYKVICPVGGEAYPRNDFYAYLKGGMKDKSLVTGPYADDGWGWQKNPGDKYKYWFVGYYAHWMARNYLLPAMENLAKAYLLTGESKYAHKCALLLWQLAQYYPDYQYENQSSYGLERDRNYRGRLLYHTWENRTVEAAAIAYDAIFPHLDQDAELQDLAGKDAAGVKQDVQERLLRTMADDIINGSHRIQGNWGMHQNAALLVALVLDDKQGKPSSPQIVDWVLSNPAPTELYTDTGFEDMLTNLLHRDGVPFESPSYNCGWMSDLAKIADLLKDNGVDLWANPRFRAVYQAPLEALVCGKFTTPLGDSNNLFTGPMGTDPRYLQQAFRQTRDPRQAQAMVQSGLPVRHDLFTEADDEAIAAAAKQYGQEIGVTSSLLPGLGNLTLQTGTPGHRTGLSLFYGYYVGHTHFDLLNVDFYAEGNPLTPDLGYPETADSGDPRRFGFIAHTVAHNTCMVNGRRQELGLGQLVAFHMGQYAQMAEVTGNAAYPETVKDYRRTVFLIDASPDQAYYVDLFHVAGGNQHDWLVHGTEAAFDANLPLSEPRTTGTLAGPDVPYGNFYDDEKLKTSTYGLPYSSYKGSAFQWLQNVQQAALQPSDKAAPWMRWTLNRDPKLYPGYPQGIKLRSHLIPDQETVFACDGIPQRRKNFPASLKWVVRRRTGIDEKLQSTFVTVHEGYKDSPIIKGVRKLDVQPAEGAMAIEVDLGTRRDVVFASRNLNQQYTVAARLKITGRGAVVSFEGGKPVRARLFDGTTLTCDGLKLTAPGLRVASIASIDYAQGLITLKAPCLRPEDVGRWVPVHSEQHEASVRIEQVLAPDRFSIGTQDLRAARGLPLTLEGKTLNTNALCYFAKPGMTIVNEQGEPLTRLVSAVGLTLTMQDDLRPAQFADANGDGKGRFNVMVIGPGDVVAVGNAADTRAR